MSSDSTSPDMGNDGTEDEYPPMMEADNEELVMALECRKQEARSAADAVTRSLLNEDVPLDGEDVSDLYDAASRLTALSDTLVHRVDERVGEMGQPSE